MENYFNALGANNVNFSLYDDGSEDILAALKDARLIYIPGGLPHLFLEKAREVNLKDIIPDSVEVIMGNSAGALVLSEHVIITKDRDYPQTIMVDGLGLVDFSVDVHYDDTHDEELMRISKGGIEIYAISENSAIVYDNVDKSMKFRGEIYSFVNGNKRRINGH